MYLQPADLSEVDWIADRWVDLAREQRAFDSHLFAEANRDLIREPIARGAIAGTVLVAHPGERHSGEVERETEWETQSGNGGEGGTTIPDDSIDPVVDEQVDCDDEAAEPLGFVMFSFETGRYSQDVTRGVVDNLYVRPGVRNRGVGSALLAAAERSLREAGADLVSLDAMAENENARRFYRRHGYAPHRIEFEKSFDREE